MIPEALWWKRKFFGEFVLKIWGFSLYCNPKFPLKEHNPNLFFLLVLQFVYYYWNISWLECIIWNSWLFVTVKLAALGDSSGSAVEKRVSFFFFFFCVVNLS